MAFVTERMTKEEKDNFAARAIPNPGNKFFILKPSKWTIDRENNVILVWALEEREEPHDNHFLLCWKDTPITVKLGECWTEGSPRTWELRHIKIPENLKAQQDEIIQILKDALEGYGFDGDPKGNNKTTKVQFNF
ncbi:hypothetical protein LY28_03297 [Ruminiclostridium sufflavum DSM 19573]|uniref:Uncharacterized protein n=2 Tax=Ruminiclostridium TaxID=1508657 RepID=A0A318XGP6_9FIRM|nr:hypothetical protein LY28_03297 [Ruminiclostridium sufflavum DSM 19573]